MNKLILFRTYVYAILAMLFWGFSFVWFKIVVNYYEPITIITLRLTVSSALLIIILWFTRSYQRIARKDVKWFLLLAFTQPFCYFLGESFGLKLVSSTISSVIISTIPVFTAFAAYFFLREKVTVSIIIGLAFSFAGILVMIVNPDLSLNAAPKGVLLLFFAVVAAVAYSAVIKRLSESYNSLMIIAVQNSLGVLYFLPFFLVLDFEHFRQVKVTAELIRSLLLLSVFASTFAYFFYIISIERIGVTRVNVFTNLIPVFTAILSYFILKEELTTGKIVGMVLVIAGVIVVQFRDFRKLALRNKIPAGTQKGE